MSLKVPTQDNVSLDWKKKFVLKYAGLEWFEKLKEGLEDRRFVKYQVDPCVWYMEEMVLIFSVDYCLMFSPYKGKIDDVYAYIQSDFNIKDDWELNRYIVIELEHQPNGLISIRQTYLTQAIIDITPGMYKPNAKPKYVVNHPLSKNEGAQTRKMTLITDQ